MEIMESSSNFWSSENRGTATVDKSLNLATLFATENCKQITIDFKINGGSTDPFVKAKKFCSKTVSSA